MSINEQGERLHCVRLGETRLEEVTEISLFLSPVEQLDEKLRLGPEVQVHGLSAHSGRGADFLDGRCSNPSGF